MTFGIKSNLERETKKKEMSKRLSKAEDLCGIFCAIKDMKIL